MSTLEVTKERLEAFSTLLQEIELSSQIYEPDENNIIRQLLVPINPNDPDAPIIQIMYVEDVLEVSNVITKKLEDFFILQFFVPIFIQDKLSYDQNEMNAFLSSLNKLIPVGYLGSGVEGVFFRHTAVTYAKNLDSGVFIETMRLVMFFTGKFYQRIRDLATGLKDKETLLKELEVEMTSF